MTRTRRPHSITLDIVTGTPEMKQIVSTTTEVDDNHKIQYMFMTGPGDPIGEYWTTQAMLPGTLVHLQDCVHEVQSLDVDFDEGVVICLVGPVLHAQPDGSWHHLPVKEE